MRREKRKRKFCDMTKVLICLMIKTLDDKQFPITLMSTSSVPELKEMITSETGVGSNRQRLIFRGKVLKNDSSIDAYAIQDGHTLHLVVNPEVSNETSSSSSTRNIKNSRSDGSNEETRSERRARRTARNSGSGSTRNINGDGHTSNNVMMGATIVVPDGTELSGSMLRSIIANMMSGMPGSDGNASTEENSEGNQPQISISTQPMNIRIRSTSRHSTSASRRSASSRGSASSSRNSSSTTPSIPSSSTSRSPSDFS